MKVTNVLELPVIDSVFGFSSYFHIKMCLLAFIVFKILYHIFIFLRFTGRVNFKQTWHKGEFKFVQIKGHKDTDSDLVIMHCRLLNIFYFRTTVPVSTKVNVKHPWLKWIQVDLNEKTFPIE